MALLVRAEIRRDSGGFSLAGNVVLYDTDFFLTVCLVIFLVSGVFLAKIYCTRALFDQEVFRWDLVMIT